ACAASAQVALPEVALRHVAWRWEVGRPRLEPHLMRLLQLELGRVLAGDDALVVIDELGEAVEQRCLARARSPRHDGVDAATADDLEDFGAFGRDAAEIDELGKRELVFLEFADGEGWAVDGQRRHDDVDARAVRQARVADRGGLIDAPADLADDALADVEKLLIVAEANSGALDLAFDFDIGRAGAVHHDV